jgi:hypothetical protein
MLISIIEQHIFFILSIYNPNIALSIGMILFKDRPEKYKI